MKRDLFAEVSARIVAELERGAAPWLKPWSATAGQNVPQNAVTNRPYSGCNITLLWLARNRGWATPRFLTFKQALGLGALAAHALDREQQLLAVRAYAEDGDELAPSHGTANP
jgi:antirestriction protein ArdC